MMMTATVTATVPEFEEWTKQITREHGTYTLREMRMGEGYIVDVTATIIALGIPGNPHACPIERALAELPFVKMAEVYDSGIVLLFMHDGTAIRGEIPKDKAQMIRAWDTGKGEFTPGPVRIARCKRLLASRRPEESGSHENKTGRKVQPTTIPGDDPAANPAPTSPTEAPSLSEKRSIAGKKGADARWGNDEHPPAKPPERLTRPRVQY